MKIETRIPDDLIAVPEWARRAEDLGYDCALASEVHSNPFIRLALVAEHTQRIGLGTGITLAFVRSPITMAYIALDLQRYSRGRLMLGLGTQTRWQIERRFGVPWSAPARRIREYIGVMRTAWQSWEDGSPFQYDGDVFKLDVMTPNHRPPTTDGAPFPRIHVAAVGPLMSRTAGAVCDGIQVHPFGTAAFVHQSVLPNLREGAAKAGRSLDGFEISGGGMIATGATPEELEKAIAGVRYSISYYGHFPEYQNVWAVEGWEDLGKKLQEYAAADRWSEMPGLIDDEVLHRFAAVGTYEQIGERILERFGSYATRVSLPVPAPGQEQKLASSMRLLQAASPTVRA